MCGSIARPANMKPQQTKIGACKSCAAACAGLEEMILADASAETAASSRPAVSAQRQQVPAAPSQPSAAASTAEGTEETQPVASKPSAAGPTLRPAPFIPNFILNPGLEAVEEDYSSSDYSDEDM